MSVQRLRLNRIGNMRFKKRLMMAEAGDIVLIAGKGHEKTQHTAEGIFPFSDVEIAKTALLETNEINMKE